MISRTVVIALRWLIRVYQLTLSPFVGMHCRYTPSCSEYAREALDRHGPILGLGLAIRRIFRCQPWGSSGFDPVPGKHTRHSNG
nr:membrane protein insertion efficiency factor YidD [Rhabdochromatium marinum]